VKPTYKVVQNPTKIRSTLTPGTICIILAGRFRGKRCVFLKSLKSGLLLVSGPYKLNGVPIRRVNQSYIIATSTKIDVSNVDVKSIDDEYFSRSKDAKKDAEEEFFKDDVPKPAVVSDQRKADQSKVDAVLLKTISATPMLEGYLASLFTLKRGDKPHLMKF
jgi:large subunit ribosomal protein L6e